MHDVLVRMKSGIKSSSLGGAGVKSDDRLRENRWWWKEKLLIGLKDNQGSTYELQRKKWGSGYT